MGTPDVPVTAGVRRLREAGIPFTPCFYPYEERGGTRHSALMLGVAEHAVVKTLVMESDPRAPFIVLMHGDCEVSTKALARFLGVKAVKPCDERSAQRHTGYQFGGTSPFGTRASLPVYVERTILDLPEIYINGGKRGFLVKIAPSELRKALQITEVEVAIPGSGLP